MKTRLVTLFLFLTFNLFAQIDFGILDLISNSSSAFNNKDYSKAIDINDEIIEQLTKRLTTEESFSKKNNIAFVLSRSYFRKARAKGYSGRLQEGFYDINSAVGAYPQYPSFNFFLTLYQTTFFDDDIDEDILFKKYGFSQDLVNIQLVKQLHDFGYFQEALTIRTNNLSKTKNPHNYYEVGSLLEITGNQKKAKKHYKKAWEAIYNEGISGFEKYTHLRILLMPKLGKELEVKDALDRAIIEQPIALPYNMIKAYNHYKNKEYEEAINAYNQILTEDPFAKNAFIYLASSHIKMGNEEKGKSILNELLVEKPNYHRALCERAKHNINSNNFELAGTDIEKALKLKPNHPLGLKLMGDLQLGLEKPKKACFYYKLAQEKYYTGVYDDSTFLENLDLACPK